MTSEPRRTDWTAVALELSPLFAIVATRVLYVLRTEDLLRVEFLPLVLLIPLIYPLGFLAGLGWWRVAGLSRTIVTYAIARMAIVVTLPALWIWLAVQEARCDGCISFHLWLTWASFGIWLAAAVFAPVVSAILITRRIKPQQPAVIAAHAG